MKNNTIPPLYRTSVAFTSWFRDNLNDIMSRRAEVTKMFRIPPEKIYESNIGRPHYMYAPLEAVGKLVPEPTNDVDPDAMTVCVDGMQIGYTASAEHDTVWPMYRAGCGCLVRITGGPYRIVDRNRDTMTGESNYRAEITLVLPV